MFSHIILIYSSLMLIGSSSNAQTQAVRNVGKFDQQVTLTDANGLPINREYKGLEGFPFLINEFKYANIELKNGRMLLFVPIKLDIYANNINFVSAEKETGIIDGTAIKRIMLIDSSTNNVELLFQTGFPAIDYHKEGEIYQVLAEGKLLLLKSATKKIETRKNDFSGEIVKEFVLYEDLYVFHNGEMKRLKKDKEFLLMLMHDKRAEMDKYLKQNKKNLKNQQILAETFRYYNQL